MREAKEEKRSRWRKLDNAALAFPAATDKKDTRVFRFYCQLKEDIDPEILQDALDKTMRRYPVFQAVLRKGLFWYYLEHRNIRAISKPESKKPCSYIYVPDAKKLLFEVTYFKNRINLEVFHALSDGTGSILFFKELVKNYLFLAHEADGLEDVVLTDELETESDNEEDSFSQYYSSKRPKGDKYSSKSYQLAGPKLEHSDIQVTEVVISVKELLEKSRSNGVSMTVFLAAALMYAIYEEMTERQQRRPVTLMIPVNLRKYFPSGSMTNFWGWLEAGYKFTPDTRFEDVLAHVKQYFEKELVKERVAMRMNDYIRLEKNPALRAVPLEIKNLFLQAGTRIRAGDITAVFSNVGVIKMPPSYEPYIRRFGVFTNTDKMQLCACSYGDELVLGFSSKLVSMNIQRNFLRILKEQGLECHIPESSFPELPKKESYVGRIAFQTFSFVCIVAAVLCVMFNVMLSPDIYWSPFACAALLCLWVCAAVGFVKRRNVLKNLMWQLVIGSVACILWDVFTGWRGWSVDFVFPLATIAIQITMFIIARARRMEVTEYLFYLVMGAGYGLIPFILLLTGAVDIVYPSVICAGLSFLYLVGLAMFRFKDMQQEFHKKFRL